ncbi:hypothetical protein QQX98_002530 [Neonectria punicea]|uniref:Ubiquitin-like domain-containing protein n=1 Tax=Neonectria punicea TaxID=979145 RepID=A0ABR1HJQ9_9HYPO
MGLETDEEIIQPQQHMEDPGIPARPGPPPQTSNDLFVAQGPPTIVEIKAPISASSSDSESEQDQDQNIDNKASGSEQPQARDTYVAKKRRETELERQAKKAPIRFKDAVGRKFSFPFHLTCTWEGMEELIKQAFVQVSILRPHVLEGHYDLIGPNGQTITPDAWEDTIEPDSLITMVMWPMDKIAPIGSKSSPLPYASPTKPPEPTTRTWGKREVQN